MMNWFMALSIRERVLIAIAGLLASVIVGVFAIAMPLLSAIDAQQTAYAKALDRRGAIEARLAEIAKNTGAAPAAPAQAATPANADPIATMLSQSAAEAGFVVDRADPQGDGGVQIVMAKAKPVALIGWINDWERKGVLVQEIGIQSAADGTVSIDATLKRGSQ
jgi:general secretion pathway protein M